MDDSGFPRTPDRPIKLLGTRVRYQRSVETTIDARGLDFLGGSATPAVSGGHEQAFVPLLVLLAGMAGGAFTGVLILLCLAFEVVKDRSDRLLTRGMAGGDVEELLGGSRALTSQLVNQGLTKQHLFIITNKLIMSSTDK